MKHYTIPPPQANNLSPHKKENESLLLLDVNAEHFLDALRARASEMNLESVSGRAKKKISELQPSTATTQHIHDEGHRDGGRQQQGTTDGRQSQLLEGDVEAKQDVERHVDVAHLRDQALRISAPGEHEQAASSEIQHRHSTEQSESRPRELPHVQCTEQTVGE